MTDLSKLSNEDLQAIATGDMSKVSTQGLQLIANPQPKNPYEASMKEAIQNVPESKRIMGSALGGNSLI